MYEQIEKPKENKSKTVANSVAQKRSNVTQGFGFVDSSNKFRFSVLQTRSENTSRSISHSEIDTGLQLVTHAKEQLKIQTSESFKGGDVAQLVDEDGTEDMQDAIKRIGENILGSTLSVLSTLIGKSSAWKMVISAFIAGAWKDIFGLIDARRLWKYGDNTDKTLLVSGYLLKYLALVIITYEGTETEEKIGHTSPKLTLALTVGAGLSLALANEIITRAENSMKQKRAVALANLP